MTNTEWMLPPVVTMTYAPLFGHVELSLIRLSSFDSCTSHLMSDLRNIYPRKYQPVWYSPLRSN